eukprot:c20581_g1_i1 orf=101-1192(+)
METAAPSHDPSWCLRSTQLCFTPRPSPLIARRHTWPSCNPPTWRASVQSPSPHPSVRFGIGSAKIKQTYATFCRNSWPSDLCHTCRGSGPGNTSSETSPEEEDSDNFLDITPVVENKESSNGESKSISEDDWRSFRARLVVGEQSGSALLDSDGHAKESLPGALSKKWAHPIPFPETGCLLVATEKLDGQAPFERSVILLLRLGSSKPQDGPFGIILNRPILHTTKESEPITERMAQMLQNCRLYYGGPLPADIFLLMRMTEGFSHLEEIMPGVFYGYVHGLQQAADLTSQDKVLHDFRFYVGYAGWDFNQLRDEIAEGFWWVAACSPDLIREASSDSLWQEVLMSMGGEYAEIGKKLEGDGL